MAENRERNGVEPLDEGTTERVRALVTGLGHRAAGERLDVTSATLARILGGLPVAAQTRKIVRLQLERGEIGQ